MLAQHVATHASGVGRPSSNGRFPTRGRGDAHSKAAKRCQQGISLGREQGIEQQRQMLRRLASVRFGAATGDRLAAAIVAEADPQRLMDVAEAIVRCTTGGELLREVGASG